MFTISGNTRTCASVEYATEAKDEAIYLATLLSRAGDNLAWVWEWTEGHGRCIYTSKSGHTYFDDASEE